MTQSTRVILAACALLLVRPLAASGQSATSAPTPPVKLAIAGVAHGHIGRIVRLIKASTDVELVGASYKDPALHALMVERYGLPRTLFDDLDVMLDKTRPEAVAAFSSTPTIAPSSRPPPRAAST